MDRCKGKSDNSEGNRSIHSTVLNEHENSTCSDVSDFPYCPRNPSSYKDLVFHGKYEAKEFYARYGRKQGFGIRLGPSVKKKMKTTNVVYVRYIHLFCRKEGKKKTNDNPGPEPSYQRAETRTGCKARLKLVIDWDKQGYVIYGWNDDHNHPMIDIDKVCLIRTYRQIRPEHKAMIDIHVNNGINVRSTFDALRDTYGSVDDMGFTMTDLWNYVSSVKRKALFEGDAIVMHKWLIKQASSNPGFFYDIEVDEERRIKTVFWADAVMISDYEKFGDFVSFDTTYRTNDTARPLGIFVGFNHHKCTTIFGAALMYDETSASFKWVFETFLKCMRSKLPKTIMTDQAPAIALAIRQVFVGVFHALCSWHIDQNARKRLGPKANTTFTDLFNQLVRYVDSESEFDFVWDKMLDTCFDGKPTSDNTWLSFIHTFRKQWSSAWVKNEFTAGKSTTQLSEQLNAFARRYLKPELHVSELMGRFQDLVNDLRYNEKLRDYYMQDTVPANHFMSSRLMREAAHLFTPCVFKLILEEYESGIGYEMMETTALEEHMSYSFQETMRVFTGQCKLFRVKRWDEDNPEILVEEEIVRLDIEQKYVRCSCRFLENSWLICRHVLRVLDLHAALGIAFCKSIPKVYYIERWMRKAAKPCVVQPISNEVVPSTYAKRYQRLYNHMVAIGTRICYNEEAFGVYMQCCYEGAKKAEEILQKSTSTKPSREEFSSTIDGEENCYESFKSRNSHTVDNDNDGSKVRLMSNNEIRHLKWRQRLRKEMEQQQLAENQVEDV